MTEKIGIENLTKVVLAGFAVGQCGINASKAEGNLQKVAAFYPLFDDLMHLYGLSLSTLKAELDDLSGEEKDVLKAKVKEKFDIADDVLEAKIELSFSATVDIVTGFQNAIKIWT
jgi:hypothetical protein